MLVTFATKKEALRFLSGCCLVPEQCAEHYLIASDYGPVVATAGPSSARLRGTEDLAGSAFSSRYLHQLFLTRPVEQTQDQTLGSAAPTRGVKRKALWEMFVNSNIRTVREAKVLAKANGMNENTATLLFYKYKKAVLKT